VLFKQGQDKALEPYLKSGQIEVVHEDWADDWKPENGKKITNAGINKAGHDIDGILVSNDGTAGGAIQALIEEGLAGKVLVTGQDADLAGCQRIVAGTQSMTIYKPLKQLAETAADYAVKMARRHPVVATSSLNNGKVDGIIMSVSGEANDHNYLRKLEQKNIPVVFFDRVYEDIEAAKVTTNDYDSSFAATEHLIDTGCKKIAYLVVNKSISIGKVRMQGYVDALQKHNVPFNDELVIDCSNDEKINYGILKKVLEEIKPDGIFSSVERLAFATYHVCNDMNINIPRDLKVISFSSLGIAPLLGPPLSTITQPAYEMGIKAATLLFDELENKGKPISKKEHVLKSKLFIRKSSMS